MSTVTDLESYQQFALQQQAQNNAWSAEQAQKQMDFQRQASDTAHQREVADLKAAGLNPILSANSGASVPNGAAASSDTSAAGNVGQILQQVLQAQSAREVAGMYNAATMAAAQIAASASMYGADMSYMSAEDHPGSIEQVIARLLVGALQGSSGSSSVVGAGAQAADALGNLLSGFGIDMDMFTPKNPGAVNNGAKAVTKALVDMGATPSSKSGPVQQVAKVISSVAKANAASRSNSSAYNSSRTYRPASSMPFMTWLSRNGYTTNGMGKAKYNLLKGLYDSGGASSALLKMLKAYKRR